MHHGGSSKKDEKEPRSAMKRLTVVGIGPGNREQMTEEACEALKEAEVIAGYRLYIDQIRELFPEAEYIVTGMKQETERCVLALEKASAGRTTAVISSGDPGVYGMAGLILEMAPKYPDVEIRIVPGVTAALSGAAVLGAPLGHDFCVISLSDLLTPRSLIEKRLRAAGAGDFAVCIYNPSSRNRADYLSWAAGILTEEKAAYMENPGDTVCGYVRQIGRDGEEHGIMSLRELAHYEADMLTTVFIGNSQTTVCGGRMVTPRGYKGILEAEQSAFSCGGKER